MPAFASFTVNDRAATPVAHTFVPQTKEPLPTWREAAAVVAGDRVFTANVKPNGVKHRVTLRFVFPTLVSEVVNGVTRYTVDRTQFAETTFTFTKDSTLQERKDTVGQHVNAMAAAITQLDGVLTNFEGIY